MGHELAPGPNWTYFLHAVEWNHADGTLSGGADPRNPPGTARVVETRKERGL